MKLQISENFTYSTHKETNHYPNTYDNLRNTFVKFRGGDYTVMNCCEFVGSRSEERNLYIFLPYGKIKYAHMDDAYVQRWVDYMESINYKVEISQTRKSVDGYAKESGYQFVITKNNKLSTESFGKYRHATLSLVRMLWSNHYHGLIDMVFKLRDDETLSHLDNWEIFHLANVITKSWGYHNIVNSEDAYNYGIFPLSTIINRRLAGGNIEMNNQDCLTNYKYIHNKVSELNEMIKAKDYLTLYKVLSSGKNSGKYAKSNMTAPGLEKGNYYEVLKVLKKKVRILDRFRDKRLVNHSDIEL